MIRTPRKLVYAIEAVLDIAYNAGATPVRSAEITGRQGIPRRYLEPVLQQLVRAGILSGLRGPRGGYLLGRERSRISLGDIVRAVGGEAELPDEAPRSPLGLKVVAPLLAELEERWAEQLDRLTLEDLCRQAYERGIESVAARLVDFVI